MTGFIDTSALFKKYAVEKGTEALIERLPEYPVLHTSALTELELLAALERAKKISRINSPVYRQLLKMIEDDFSGSAIQQVDITLSVRQIARRLVLQRKLRAADAIQLASAIELNRLLKSEIVFICSDSLLTDAARLEGIKVFDPAH